MSNIQQLKRRIKSIKSTSQLTKAMQTVAAMRFKKNLVRANRAIDYELVLEDFKKDISKIITEDFNSEFISRNGSKKLVLVLGPTRGFCGGLNRSITNYVHKVLKDEGVDTSDEEQVNFITINKPAYTQVSRRGGRILASFVELSKNPDEYDLLAISEYLYKLFLEDKSISEVFIAYASIKDSPIKYEKILPLSRKEIVSTDQNQDQEIDKEMLDTNIDSLWEEFIHQYLQATIQNALMQTYSAEEKARMVSMNQATENAKKLTNSLQLIYFKERQAKITQEMSEIASNV